MKKIISMLIVLVGFLASCTNQVTTENSTGSAVLDRIYKKQKIVIGTTADYPPFEWHYINDGKDSVVGIDIDYETVGKDSSMLMVSVSGTAVKLHH